jgi:hypothetical protein
MLLKLHHSVVGLPDRLLLRPKWRATPSTAIFVEFKRPGEEPTQIQQHYLRQFELLGFKAVVVRTRAEFKALLTP